MQHQPVFKLHPVWLPVEPPLVSEKVVIKQRHKQHKKLSKSSTVYFMQNNTKWLPFLGRWKILQCHHRVLTHYWCSSTDGCCWKSEQYVQCLYSNNW